MHDGDAIFAAVVGGVCLVFAVAFITAIIVYHGPLA